MKHQELKLETKIVVYYQNQSTDINTDSNYDQYHHLSFS